MKNILYKLFPFLKPKRKNPFRDMAKRIDKCEKAALKRLNSKRNMKKFKKIFEE